MEIIWYNLPFFSIMLPLASAALTSVMPPKVARAVSMSVVAAVAIMSGAMLLRLSGDGQSYVFMMGHYPAPWGNEIRFGVLEVLVATFFAVVMLLSLCAGMRKIEEQVREHKRTYYYVVIELLLAALMTQVYTNDLFTSYVFVEIMTIAGCTLITLRTKGQTLVAGTRYMLMNLLGSGLFLLGITLIYDISGHLLMSDIQRQVALMAENGTYSQPLTAAIILMLIGLSIKSALFPFHTWIPDTYSYSTPASSAILSSLISKGYIFLIIKIIFRVIGFEVIASSRIINVLFAFSLVGIIMGSLAAIREKDIRRMISFSSVAQVGYIFMGIGMGTLEGMVAAVFHMLVHAAAKSMLFLSASGLSDASGDSKLFKDLRGSATRNPVAGVAFTIGAFSMVGIPFFGGFISKLNLANAALNLNTATMVVVMAVLAASTVLNTIYFLKTVITIYRPAGCEVVSAQGSGRLFAVSMGAFVIMNLILGTLSAPIIDMIQRGLSIFS